MTADTRISFAAACRSAANELALWSPTARLGMHTDILALRQLAALIEQVEQSLPNIAVLEGRENECVGYCIELAAGFHTTPAETEGEGR
jgi:hypothetical protein